MRTPIRGAGGTSGSVGARKRKKAGDLDEAEGEEPGEDEGQGRRTIQVQTDRSAREKRLEMYQQMAMGRVDPFRANDSTADWTVDIPSIIDQCTRHSQSIVTATTNVPFQILAVLDFTSNRKA